MSKDTLFVLAVALLTWGGVFVYLLRMERLARDLERELRAGLDARADRIQPSGEPAASEREASLRG